MPQEPKYQEAIERLMEGAPEMWERLVNQNALASSAFAIMFMTAGLLCMFGFLYTARSWQGKTRWQIKEGSDSEPTACFAFLFSVVGMLTFATTGGYALCEALTPELALIKDLTQ